MSDLLIVIVNYRTAGLTIDCLRSLVPERATAGFRVVVTDNDSGDGSAGRLAAAVADNGWGDWVTIQPLAHNGGFAFGNNAAIRPALGSAEAPRYVLLLNPDVVVRPGAVRALVDFMDRHPEAGIAGSRLEDPDGTPQRAAFRFPTLLGEIEDSVRLGPVTRLLERWVIAPPVPDRAGPVDWVAGASMIVRREVFEAAGLLDEGYFMYYEEVDFCLRARRAGWPCWFVPGSRVVHLVGQSSGVTDPRVSRKRRPAFWFHSRRRYFLRNLGPIRCATIQAAWVAGYLASRSIQILRGRRDTRPRYFLWDFLRYNVLPAGR